jgi:tetratricopeptide (TPR) repeat protein
VVLARNFVESILEGDQVLGFTPLIRNSFYSFFDHFFLFYVSTFLWLVIILSILADEDVKNVGKLAVLFSPVILIVPLIDIFLSRGMGYKLGYLEGVSQVLPAVQLFDLRGQLLQITWGQRIEVISVCCFASSYVWLKRCSLPRSVAVFILAYLAMFVHGLPQAFVDIPKAFGFDHGVRAIMGGGLVDVDSQNYALYMLLLCIPAVLLLLRMHDRELLRRLVRGVSGGRWWAVALSCSAGFAVGHLLFRDIYHMTFVNPYSYLAAAATLGAFILAGARTQDRTMLLLGGTTAGFLSLNVGWTCMLLAGCTFIAARFRRTTPLVLVFSLAGGLSLFAQHHALTILTPGGITRLKGFAAYRQAREYFIQKDWERARLSYQSGLSRGVVNHELYERLAESLVNLGLQDSAVSLFDRAIVTSGNDPEPYLGLGGIYQAKGEFDATIQVYERAIENRVLPDRFHLEKARVYCRIREFERARISLGVAAAMGAKRELLYTALADLAFFSQDLEEAYRLYERVLSYRPRHALAYNGMANIRHVQSRFEEALQLYLKALELSPNDPTILNNAGAAYLELGILDKAYQSVSKALAIYPMLAEAHYNMGRLFELAGAREEAMESYRKALAVNPNVTGARDALESLEGGLP